MKIQIPFLKQPQEDYTVLQGQGRRSLCICISSYCPKTNTSDVVEMQLQELTAYLLEPDWFPFDAFLALFDVGWFGSWSSTKWNTQFFCITTLINITVISRVDCILLRIVIACSQPPTAHQMASLRLKRQMTNERTTKKGSFFNEPDVVTYMSVLRQTTQPQWPQGILLTH